MWTLDAIDLAILRELTANARVSIKRLAERINLSAPACAARIQRLEKGGVLVGYRALVDPERLGYEITALIQVEVAPADWEAFETLVRNEPAVLSCDRVTGACAAFLRAQFRTRRDFAAFIQAVERFGRSQSQVVVESLRLTPREPGP